MVMTLDLRGSDWPDPAGQGGPGAVGDPQTGHGTNAESHYDSGDCSHHCDTQQGKGPKGNTGHTGDPGDTGQKGKTGKAGTISLGDIQSDTQIIIGGGKGQTGGKGGTGGPGSAGGDPGSTAQGCKNDAAQGDQGTGGKGGPGGTGGPGGDCDYCAIYYSNSGGFNVQISAEPSIGGDPGEPGDPGAGTGNDGKGDPGVKGDDGPAPNYDVYSN